MRIPRVSEPKQENVMHAQTLALRTVESVADLERCV